MCNWGWLGGPIGGVLVGNDQRKKDDARKKAELANQQLQQSLLDKDKQNAETLGNVNKAVDTDPLKSNESLTNTNSLKPKRTISTLSLPFGNSGLNVR